MKSRALVAALVIAVAMSGCSTAKKAASPRDTTPRGGILHVVEPLDTTVISSTKPPFPPLDPQIEWSYDSWELYRCCLLRTLLSYSGQTTTDGGAELRPDLAAALPDVSADGLTWTFHLKPGIRYGPPLSDVFVSSQDFIRAITRMAKLGGDSYGGVYFTIIRGYSDYAKGKSDSVSGLEAPDPRTLVIRLNEPAGDLGSRLAMAGTAPIPPLPTDPSASFGVATGHDKEGYGFFLVSTGPYMIEGSDKLDFSKAPAKQPRLSGLSAGHLITLVRNPSWVAATDDLRKGYVDRIELRFVDGDRTAMSKLATTGKSDVDFSVGPQDASLVALAERVRSDPSLGTAHVASADFVRFTSMNLALPPFDDVHVRRALNLVINKQRLVAIRGGPLGAAVAGHIAFDSLEDNLLLSYKPYATPNDGGDLERAKHEMSLSRYDKNHDGVCDAAACRDIVGYVTDFGDLAPIGREIARQVVSLGIHIRVKVEDPGLVFEQISDPKTHAPISLTLGWGKDYLNASNFILPLFSKDRLGGPNHSLLGATPAQLRGWGYKVTSTPSIDDRIAYCLRLVGPGQIRCWSSLDQYLTEQVVPWVPLFFETNIVITSPRVVAFSYDQYAIQPSLDRIAFKPGSSTS